jgi:hypothetical protein
MAEKSRPSGSVFLRNAVLWCGGNTHEGRRTVRRRLLVSLGVLLLIAPPSAPAERTTRVVDLVIRHADGKVDTREGDRVVEVGTLDETMEYKQRHNEVIKIVVADPNPLLFSYKWKGVTRTKTADFEAATKFAESLAALGPLLKALTGVPSTEAAAAAAEDARASGEEIQAARYEDSAEKLKALEEAGIKDDFFARFGEDFDELLGYVQQIEQRVADSAGDKAAENAVKTTALSWDVAGLSRRLEASFGRVDQAQINLLSLLNEEAGSLEPSSENAETEISRLTKRLDDLVTLMTDALREPGASKASASSASTVSQDAGGSGDSAASPGADLGGKELKKKDRIDDSEADGTSVANQYVEAVLLIKDQESNIREMLEATEGFREAAAQINEPIELGEVEFTASEDARAAIGISAVEGAADAAAKSKREPGDFTFALSPFSPASLSVGPAIVYSFVDLREFGTTKDGDNLRVVRTDDGDEVNGAAIAAMLGITPRAWSNPILSTSFEIGLSPIEDEIGFFGGISMRAYKKFRFGAGVALQETERLKRGLALGQVVESPDDLETDSEFETGAYVSFTLDLK